MVCVYRVHTWIYEGNFISSRITLSLSPANHSPDSTLKHQQCLSHDQQALLILLLILLRTGGLYSDPSRPCGVSSIRNITLLYDPGQKIILVSCNTEGFIFKLGFVIFLFKPSYVIFPYGPSFRPLGYILIFCNEAY